MANSTSNPRCPNCERLEKLVEQLRAQVAEQALRIQELERKLAAATKDSTNSSKPPSSDIVKPGKRRRPTGKTKRGGRKGHKRNLRQALPTDELDWLTQYSYDACPDCGGPVQVDTQDPASVLQQIEVVAKPTEATEHQSLRCYCAACQKTHTCPIPPEVRKAGLCGPELTSIIGFLKGACHASISTIRKYLRDVYDLRLSRGMLQKIIYKVSEAIAPIYESLFDNLKAERVLNVDETGHRDSGQKMWTWCFRSDGFTVFHIDPRRSSGVLLDVLGEEFDGVIGCDYFSAYHKYRGLTDCAVQFCFAHLIRDLRFLKEHSTGRTHGWAGRLLDAIRDMFRIIHEREKLGKRFEGELEDAAMMVLMRATYRVPDDSKAQNLARRFEEHGDDYLRFLTTPGLEPTNNIAERAIRFVVIDRRVTQGSKSEQGQRWLERIWTLMATCEQQGLSLFDCLREAVKQNLAGEPPPSLLPGV